ncbi:hypothetical protein D3C73_1510320 [compost metagenome]
MMGLLNLLEEKLDRIEVASEHDAITTQVIKELENILIQATAEVEIFLAQIQKG